MFLKRFLLFFLLAVSLCCGALAFFSVPIPALAQVTDAGLAEIGSTINLPNTDPRVIAARIINIALSTLGIIFVILIIYAGFLYMTAGGDASKTQRAIAMIRNGIIGLIIILLSWALARYILTRLMEATGTGGGTTTGGGGTGGIGGGTGSSVFTIRSITPSGSVTTRKVIVKIIFSRPVDATSAVANGMITVTRISDNASIAGTVTSTGSVVRFIPNQPCPAPNGDRFCFDENTQYRVTVSSQLRSLAGQTLTCGGFAAGCTGEFQSGTAVDVTPPDVTLTEPINGFGVPIDSLVNVRAFTRDETGVSYVEFRDNGTVFGNDAPTGITPTIFSAQAQWDTAGLPVGTTRSLQASAYDVDSGAADSAAVSVVLRAQHCFNGAQDQGETGVDCGGVSTSADYCGACSGGACTTDTDCASGVCQAGVCVERPIITSIDPMDGAPGSYVTVRGVNFGSNGTVDFLGTSGAPIRALPPTACSDAGITTWSPTQVVIEVPTGAQSGPIRLTNAASGLSDATNALPDPVIQDFIVNDTRRPGICALVPSQSRPSDRFTVFGTNFGTTSAELLFGTRVLAATSWLEQRIQSAVPNVAVGAYDVSVNISGAVSNAVSMQVLSTESGGAPVIASIDPAQGPVGTMVTINGSNFGTSVGSVFFEREGTGEIALADTSLPAACSVGSWKDGSIVVKVPSAFTQIGTGNVLPGTYGVYVKTARPTAPNSNRVGFVVNTDPIPPGICSIVPRVAPIGTRVAIYGEGFTAGPGTIQYFDSIVDPSATWGTNQIASMIPVGAQSGAVTVQPASGGTSNGYQIQVRNCNEAANVCSATETCCADGACIPDGSTCAVAPVRAMYAWQFSTGIIPRAPQVVEQCSSSVLPSPSPWSQRTGGDQACVNVRPIIVFSTLIEPSTVTAQSGNISVYRCTGADSNPCQTTEQNPIALQGIQFIADSSNRNAVVLNPGTLTQSTWYQVRLTTGIRGAGANGLPMTEDSARCGAGSSYCYSFRTRNDTTPCAIGSVEIAPDPYTANDLETPIDYLAVPRAAGDICQAIACEPYAWTWGTSDARAMVSHLPNPDATIGGEACQQVVTPVTETGESNPVQITAEAAGTTGAGSLYIRLVPPQVTSYGPNCDTACVNSRIWAVFNVPMDPASINTSNIRIERCRNESCQELMNPPTVDLPVGSVQLTSIPDTSGTNNRFLSISPQSGGTSLLTPGSFYRVILLTREGSGIRSSTMMPLTGLNNPDGFAWIFRVRPGDDSFCQPSRVDVTPTEKYESRVGARQGFFAAPFTEPDQCSEQGQLLMSLGGYSWSIDDVNVATLLNGGAIDTASVRVPGCNGACTQIGSQGQAGKIARCGDGVVQTTDVSYCISGRTRSGASCVVLAAGSVGSEECDETSALCNSRCLWEPVVSISQTNGTCGDGNIQANEDCDYGSICIGANAASGIVDGTDCTRNRAACTSAGGTCEPRETRGCSIFCRNLGSRSGGSTCGNSDVADGEDCDDGNVTNGDGCSANCVYEGSSREITSLCGNGIIEAGEACERAPSNGPWPAGCDQKTCLNTGTSPCATATSAACCGNGVTEGGEDCEDGNTNPGDGCSPICKLEGSSESYAVASFCGDGVRGMGEVAACELLPSGTDGLIDDYQVAETVGRATLPAGETLMSTQIHATYQSVTGNATYGLRCGYSREDQCSQNGGFDPLVGLSDQGCCSMRPSLTARYPLDGETNVCRNALIYGDFNTVMDTNSLSQAFVVGQRITGTSCPSGQTQVSIERMPKPTGVKGAIVRAWNAIRVFFGGRDAYAQVVCSGGITGRLSFVNATTTSGTVFTRFFFTLDHVLDANASTTVIFRGDASLADNTAKDNKVGIRTLTGVVANQDYRWTFSTGDEICVVNQTDVQDTDATHPGLFLRADEPHIYVATARSWHGGRLVTISSTEEYQWQWQNWALSNTQIASLTPTVLPSDALNFSISSSTITSKRVSGTGYVTARVIITRDTVNTPSTVDRVIQGTDAITVNVCENPWPSRADAPFRDEENSPSLAGTSFAAGPNFYNFSTMYCRDAGDLGPLGDLPSLVINAVPTNAVDASQGILRQYLFTFAEPEYKKDAIGIRIAANPMHLSPEEWYKSKGFVGKPQALTIDGYQAIRDGRTVYISAVSTDGPNTRMYSNIYIISFNDGAEPVTRQIYDALLSALSFNRNVQSDVAAVCQTMTGSVISGANNAPVSCVSDIDCRSYGEDLRCANFKAKLQRDLVRLSDFEKMTRLFDAKKSKEGIYPTLQEGSYISGLSTSLWPSWQDSLGKSVGTLPTDPLNRFVTCGRCSNSKTACTVDADCPADGGTCVTEEGFDPQTCWNTTSLQFACAVQNTSTNIPTSRIYMYRSQDQGKRYQLSSEFEVRPPDPQNVGTNWWWPPLPTEVRQCTSGDLKGAFCATDADCSLCPNNNCTNVPVITGSCQVIGGSYQYVNICRGETLGQSSTCGDGVLNTTGSTPEVCETVGVTASRYSACRTAGGSSGYRRQVCNACREYIDDAASVCTVGAQCGNGKIDGSCGGDVTRPCQTNAECGGNTYCFTMESCDEGTANGTYGHCNLTCNGYGASCGDGMVSAGEKCDLGTNNTEWIGGPAQSSCNLSCTGLASHCGDNIVTKPYEQCDGNTEKTAKGLCSDQSTPCSTNADCPSGQSCTTEACPLIHVCTGASAASGLNGTPCDSSTGRAACMAAGGTCSTEAYQTERTRTCFPMTCSWAGWTVCQFPQTCGNGIKEGAEACDDGNQDNSDGCTTSCKRNSCGDGYQYKGVEECDMGTQNGQGCSVSAEYGSTCTSCSPSCRFQLTQGGFCGDTIKNPGSSEQCDGAATVPAYGTATNQLSCLSLGYDYLKPGLTKIQCSQSCSYTGCAYCGDPPPAGTTDPLYQGVVEGILFDTLFQQPVPNARVTLFYRGLQIAVTNSDQRGYFEFTGLDRHTGCNQYRITIDSYFDNKLTDTFDESQRGGYMTVQTPAFTAYLSSNATDRAAYTSIMTRAGIAVTNSTYDSSRTIPQYSMLPRLKEKEYIVQFWWTPVDGSNDAAIQRFRNAIGTGDEASQIAASAAVYGGYQDELHDLVVRTPYTYAPGTYASCSLSTKPKNYNPADTDDLPTLPEGTLMRAGRNYTTYQSDSTGVPGLTRGGINPSDGSMWFTRDRFREVGVYIPTWDSMRRDWGWQVGTRGVDQADAVTGMLTCTNKIRASAGRVCAEVSSSGSVVNDFGRRYGCIVDADCTREVKFNLKPGTSGNSIVCSNSASELDRTGSLQVLNGKEGAYLFCFHPEWPDGTKMRGESKCSNFIVPPQSVFVHGVSGVYDILISKFRMFVNGHSNEPRDWIGGSASPAWDGNAGNRLSIRTWLRDRDASIRVYDQNGLYKEYRYNDISSRGGSAADQVSPWSGFDNSPWVLPTNPSGRNTFARQTDVERYTQLYPISTSPVWTPLSIDVTNKQVNEWNGGNYGADYRYFSDLFMNDTEMYVSWVGGGYHPATTAACVQYSNGTVEPDLADGQGICNGPDYYWDVNNSPACTTADRAIGTDNSMTQLRSVVDTGTGYFGVERCTKACTADEDCPSPPGVTGLRNFCVPRGGCAGVAGPYVPPSR